jgi:hypothetical protein
MKTQYTGDSDQLVEFALDALRLDGIANKEKLKVWGLMPGKIGGATEAVAAAEATIGLQDILDGFTAAEKNAAKVFLTAMERVMKNKLEELKAEDYNDSDTFN